MIAAIGIGLAAFPADARTGNVELISDPANKSMRVEMVEGKEKKAVTFSIIPLFERTEQVQSGEPHSVFTAIKNVPYHLPGVDYSIADKTKFHDLVFHEAAKYGFSEGKITSLKPSDAFQMAELIVAKRFTYANKMDSRYEDMINHTPIDTLIAQTGIGVVCRQYVEGVVAVYDVFANDSRAQSLHRTILRPGTYRPGVDADYMHAVVDVIDDISPSEDDQRIEFSFFETIWNPVKGFNSNFANASKMQSKGFLPIYDQYLKHIFDPNTQINSLKEFLISEVDSKAKLGIAAEVTFLYSSQIRSSYQSGDARKAESLFNDFRPWIHEQAVSLRAYAQSQEYDTLQSVALNIYTLCAEHQDEKGKREKVENEGAALRTQGFNERFEALKKMKDFPIALKAGEEYADFLGKTRDVEGAENIYRSLFDLYQENASQVGIYERSLPDPEHPDGIWKKIQPFQDQKSFETYLKYKKTKIWTKQ